MQVLSHQRSDSLASLRKMVSADGRVPLHVGRVRNTRSWLSRGFTIIELMVTLTVAGVLLAIAVPSFRNFILSNRLTTTANDLIMAINVARMEAVKLNANTQFCSDLAANNMTDPLGAACTTQTGAVYAMTGTTVTPVQAAIAGIAAPLQLSGNVTALRFTSQGVGQKAGTTLPYGDTVADICTSQLSSNNYIEIKMTGGSILESTTYTRTCP